MPTEKIPDNCIRLCIDHCGDKKFDGRIFGVALKEPVSFSGLRSFISVIEVTFDNIGKPQPHQITRSFKDIALKPISFLANPPRFHTAEEILAQTGQKETIDLIMLSRQHTEWQGLLKDPEGNSIGRFSSVLGCIQLITGSK